MTDYDIKLNANTLHNLLSDPTAITKMLEPILNQVLQFQASEQLNAEPYERSEARSSRRPASDS